MQIFGLFAPNHCLTPPNLTLDHGSGRTGFKAGHFCSFRRAPFRQCGHGAARRLRIRCGASRDHETDDGYYIRRCVEIARKAVGCTSPNPMVGCVIVNDGKVVGEGFHPKAGQPHAEVFALRDAGDLAEGATAYVSLEPCNHYGRTPPCTEALLKAKVKKVVVGMVDPNPIVAFKGVDKLRAAGVEVTVGVEEELCRNLNEAYIHQMLTGKPFVTLRYSIALNGQVVNQLGEGADKFGGYYSKLLQEYDAVIISSTLLASDVSAPTSQEPGANQPLRIIMSRGLEGSALDIPSLPTDVRSKIVVFSERRGVGEPDPSIAGVETIVSDKINMHDILEYCQLQRFCNVLVDLRGNLKDLEELLKEAAEQNVLQKVLVEVLPFWDGSDVNGSKQLTGILKGLKAKNLKPCVFGQSIVLEAYF
ncbi:hypothetical protein SAY86_012171 [Trapa natans]|uniref:Riboflavin biosynthesis protein PYRD, chloroplastic n=1 Tax=Trapa natans TaxID=22666 RepID=A0AAN7R8Z3_TRANT|nr:hypothetical protein SAY86_012171 [Trapa natans]